MKKTAFDADQRGPTRMDTEVDHRSASIRAKESFITCSGRPRGRPSAGARLPVHVPDGLDFLVLIQRFQAVVAAAESRAFVAAERCRDVALGKTVDRHGTGADRACDAPGAMHVLGIDGRGESVIGVVGETNRFLLA